MMVRQKSSRPERCNAQLQFSTESEALSPFAVNPKFGLFV